MCTEVNEMKTKRIIRKDGKDTKTHITFNIQSLSLLFFFFVFFFFSLVLQRMNYHVEQNETTNHTTRIHKSRLGNVEVSQLMRSCSMQHNAHTYIHTTFVL